MIKVITIVFLEFLFIKLFSLNLRTVSIIRQKKKKRKESSWVKKQVFSGKNIVQKVQRR